MPTVTNTTTPAAGNNLAPVTSSPAASDQAASPKASSPSPSPVANPTPAAGAPVDATHVLQQSPIINTLPAVTQADTVPPITAPEVTSPATSGNCSFANAVAVTPGDELPAASESLYVGIGGIVIAEMAAGGQARFYNVQPGSVLPIRAKRVFPESTASEIVSLW